MIDWLVETQARGDWREHFPDIARYDPFDYAAEDEVLSQLSDQARAKASETDEFGCKLVARTGSMPAKLNV